MSTAISLVIDLPELLENILLCLDDGTFEGMRTLLLSQRVAKVFQQTIEGSIKLQRALFFREDPSQATSSDYAKENPLFFRVPFGSCSHFKIRAHLLRRSRHGGQLLRLIVDGPRADLNIPSSSSWRRMLLHCSPPQALVQVIKANYEQSTIGMWLTDGCTCTKASLTMEEALDIALA